MAARASSAEKRLKATEDQYQLLRDKFENGKVKTSSAEEQWMARLRELQKRNQELEEKAKRERQGAKERIRELEHTIRSVAISRTVTTRLSEAAVKRKDWSMRPIREAIC